MSDCLCDIGGMGNLGAPQCKADFSVIEKTIFVPTYKEDGSKNGILPADFVDGKLPDNYFNDWLNNPVPTDRIYINDGLYTSVVLSPTDGTSETLDSGAIIRILKGTQGFEGQLKGASPAMTGQLETIRCTEMSVYFEDINGKLLGSIGSDGIFYPLKIQEDSFTADWFATTGTTGSYVNVSFQLKRTENTADFLTLNPSSITEDLTSAKSLIDITLTDKGTTSASVIFDAAIKYYYEAGNPAYLKGKTGVDATASKWWSVTVGGVEVPLASVTNSNDLITITPVTAFSVADEVIVKYTESRPSLSSFGYESNSLSITI